jgi:hypothetical protein
LGLVVALAVILGAVFVRPADASILEQLNEIYGLLEEDPSAEVTLSKHFVEATALIAVKGAQERKQVRHALWLLMLGGDRLEVYLAEGYPSHRHRENHAGITRELWSYPKSRTTYIFKDGNLIGTQLYSIELYRPETVETYRPHTVFP